MMTVGQNLGESLPEVYLERKGCLRLLCTIMIIMIIMNNYDNQELMQRRRTQSGDWSKEEKEVWTIKSLLQSGANVILVAPLIFHTNRLMLNKSNQN